MKKIGIITYQRAHNYGAILQCLALQEFIKQNTDSAVSVIDYKPEYLKYYQCFLWQRFLPTHPITFLKELFFLKRRFLRYRSFDNYIKSHLNLDDGYSDNLSEYDIVIIGSDQLWNINNTNGIFDRMYWGRFKTKDTPQLVTYAVSMGGCTTIDWTLVKKYAANFSSISVREKYLMENLGHFTGIPSQWVLDPTLLQKRSFWMCQSTDANNRRPYLFYYQARNNRNAIRYAKAAAEMMDLDFVCVSAHILLPNSKDGIKANPTTFLNLIRNASYVITTSFHGTVFCLQFHKDFSTLILDDGEDGRSSSLLNSIGLSGHLVPMNKPIETIPVDWDEVDKTLESLRKESEEWLLKTI